MLSRVCCVVWRLCWCSFSPKYNRWVEKMTSNMEIYIRKQASQFMKQNNNVTLQYFTAYAKWMQILSIQKIVKWMQAKMYGLIFLKLSLICSTAQLSVRENLPGFTPAGEDFNEEVGAHTATHARHSFTVVDGRCLTTQEPLCAGLCQSFLVPTHSVCLTRTSDPICDCV